MPVQRDEGADINSLCLTMRARALIPCARLHVQERGENQFLWHITSVQGVEYSVCDNMRTRESSQPNTYFSGRMHTGGLLTKRVTAANQELVLVAVELCKMMVLHEECSAHRTHTCVILQAYREYILCASHTTRASDRSQSNTGLNGFGFMHVAIFQSIWHGHEEG